jgi:NTE family protein
MVFHIGVLWRLYETGLLGGIKRISSVSGGSITAGLLGLKWRGLSFDPSKLGNDFVPQVVEPLRRLAGETIDADAIILGNLLPGTVSERIARAYDDRLFKGATLQDLPDAPRFVINATNVQSGALWRFMKPYMRDYRVGGVDEPRVPLALAVAASSAFPPVLSPVELRLDPDAFKPASGLDLQRPPFTTRVILTDGGVYDNLGLETAWKRYQTILVSDAGGKTQAEEEPHTDPVRHAYRVLDLVDNQVRSLRKRQLIDSYEAKEGDAAHRKGTYWGIRTNIKDYGLPDDETLDCPFERTLELAETPTRLKRMDDSLQERLINWGYAVCGAALRRHVKPDLPKGEFPYARGV